MNLCERLQVFSSTVYPAVVFQGLARTAAPLLIFIARGSTKCLLLYRSLGLRGLANVFAIHLPVQYRNAKKVFDLAT